MQYVKVILLLLLGFVLLIKSSDVFVDAVSSIATNFKMSKMMIALTVAAFGTCAPELAHLIVYLVVVVILPLLMYLEVM